MFFRFLAKRRANNEVDDGEGRSGRFSNPAVEQRNRMEREKEAKSFRQSL